MAAHDAGVEVVCPVCGRTVLQKAMIPVLAGEGPGIRYLCVLCARDLVSTVPAVPGGAVRGEGSNSSGTGPAGDGAEPGLAPGQSPEAAPAGEASGGEGAGSGG